MIGKKEKKNRTRAYLNIRRRNTHKRNEVFLTKSFVVVVVVVVDVNASVFAKVKAHTKMQQQNELSTFVNSIRLLLLPHANN